MGADAGDVEVSGGVFEDDQCREPGAQRGVYVEDLYVAGATLAGR
jgi:hypothetical protein